MCFLGHRMRFQKEHYNLFCAFLHAGVRQRSERGSDRDCRPAWRSPPAVTIIRFAQRNNRRFANPLVLHVIFNDLSSPQLLMGREGRTLSARMCDKANERRARDVNPPKQKKGRNEARTQ